LARKKMDVYLRDRSYDITVVMVTGYGLKARGIRVQLPLEPRIFFSLQ
jgi:hypothetical protein